MLPLDHPSWNDLKTQVGKASDVPELIRRWQGAIGQPSEEDCWDDLWSQILYELEITDAAFAVIPYVAQELDRVEPHRWLDYLWVFEHVEIARLKADAPAPPPALVNSYGAAVKRAQRIAIQALSLDLPKGDFLSVVCALCSLQGHPVLGDLIGRLGAICKRCPKCGEFICPQEIQQSGYFWILPD
jgi:hypothetical protein